MFGRSSRVIARTAACCGVELGQRGQRSPGCAWPPRCSASANAGAADRSLGRRRGVDLDAGRIRSPRPAPRATPPARCSLHCVEPPAPPRRPARASDRSAAACRSSSPACAKSRWVSARLYASSVAVSTALPASTAWNDSSTPSATSSATSSASARASADARVGDGDLRRDAPEVVHLLIDADRRRSSTRTATSRRSPASATSSRRCAGCPSRARRDSWRSCCSTWRRRAARWRRSAAATPLAARAPRPCGGDGLGERGANAWLMGARVVERLGERHRRRRRQTGCDQECREHGCGRSEQVPCQGKRAETLIRAARRPRRVMHNA